MPELAPAVRSGSAGEAIRAGDLLWLALALLFIALAAGFGLREPWPADEPRFAVVARDMVASGDWLFPRVGGDLYQDKPPLFFWLIALAYSITGSLRLSFLLPSMVAAGASLFLVFDLVRRLHGREAGLAGALALACTLQFLLVERAAQIDGTLMGIVSLSVYGFLRHLLLGPAWRWYALGAFAAGLGVITKGVGFLPLLLLVPYALVRRAQWSGLPAIAGGGGRWWIALGAALLGIFLWFVPMLVAVQASGSPELAAYRDEILFQQTVKRYASAWHHVHPWWFFLVEVIPPLWLPFSALLFWLVPRWRAAWRERDARTWVPLGWVLLVVLFFSLSTGKRDIYVAPALPALAIAAAPYLPALYARAGVRRLSVALGLVLVAILAAYVAGHLAGAKFVARAVASIGFDPFASVAAMLAACGLAWLVATLWRPLLAWPATLAAAAVVTAVDVTPRIDALRSSRAFVERMLAQVPAGAELGLMAYKEQFLLYLDRPVVNFGHSRWREGPAEGYDAARWLAAAPGRVLLVPDDNVAECFGASPRRSVGRSSDSEWFLVTAPVAPACVGRGHPARAIRYVPPAASR